MSALVRFVFGGICYWLFLPCVLLSAAAGVCVPFWASIDLWWTYPVTMPITSILAFLLSYRIAVLGTVGCVERARQIVLEKPRLKTGVIYSVVLTYAIMVGFFVLSFIGILDDLVTGPGH